MSRRKLRTSTRNTEATRLARICSSLEDEMMQAQVNFDNHPCEKTEHVLEAATEDYENAVDDLHNYLAEWEAEYA